MNQNLFAMTFNDLKCYCCLLFLLFIVFWIVVLKFLFVLNFKLGPHRVLYIHMITKTWRPPFIILCNSVYLVTFVHYLYTFNHYKLRFFFSVQHPNHSNTSIHWVRIQKGKKARNLKLVLNQIQAMWFQEIVICSASASNIFLIIVTHCE
jgi:hypothetical protein